MLTSGLMQSEAFDHHDPRAGCLPFGAVLNSLESHDELQQPMAKRNLNVKTHDDAQSMAHQLGKLIEVNERLQREIAKQITSEHAWKEERSLLLALINQVPDYLFVKDRESRYILANSAAASDLVQAKPEAMVGKTDFDLHPIKVAAHFFADDQEVMQSGKQKLDIEEFMIDTAGAKKWLSTSKVPLRNDRYEIIGVVGVARDVTRRKEAEEQVHFLAHHDPLTGLPNRALFADRLGQAILHAKALRHRVTVIFLDLDKFKLVNDSLGHLAGDTLLKIAAGRMVGCLRTTDTVARLGGDEFVILLNASPKGQRELAPIVEKIRASIAAPVEISGQQFTSTTSMGVANYPEDGLDPEDLLAHADAAMYRAKELGRDNFQFYSAAMTTSVIERLSFAEGLRKALAADEFVLHYQPQIDLKTGCIFAVEALIRWQHPELGFVPPGQFIPLAEETGLIIPIGKWVIETACAQNAQWQKDGLPPIGVSVNVSARQFDCKDFVKHVKDALGKSGLEAKYLDLEITESSIMKDLHQAIATMQELEAIGVHLSIDDFGIGYSSLSALKSFPIARLKIDQSFVQGLSSDADDRAITAAVISLGQKLKLRVIAEGVETDQQLTFLQENGCDEVQGFHFSKAIQPDDLANLLRIQQLSNVNSARS